MLKPRILEVTPDFSLTSYSTANQCPNPVVAPIALLIHHFVSTYGHLLGLIISLFRSTWLFQVDYSKTLLVIFPENSLAFLEFHLHTASSCLSKMQMCLSHLPI